MSFRDPKIYMIEVLHKNPFRHVALVGEYLLDVSIGAAFFSTTKHVDCATVYSLDEASTICSNFNKMSPEHFVIKLKPIFNVPIQYGKDNYTLPSKLNDFDSDGDYSAPVIEDVPTGDAD